MAVNLPAPEILARELAQRIAANRDAFLVWPLVRICQDAPWADRQALLAGLLDFHRERMAKVPDPARYPDARPWVESRLAVDRLLTEQYGLKFEELAQLRSLYEYVQYRGFRIIRPPAAPKVERCRVAYLPESDQGAFHIKNVDDPIEHYRPDPNPVTVMPLQGPLNWDGTGSGLHLDDEPEDTFPLPLTEMCLALCQDVPGALAFLTRYSPFGGNFNCVLHDRQKRCAAVEKCSHNFIETFGPDRNGGAHCSGMACRDPQSPLGQYQARKRKEYLDLVGLDESGSDWAFWQACYQKEAQLAAAMNTPGVSPGHSPGPVKVQPLLDLFTRPASQGGFNKDGVKNHPDQAVAEYTLMIRVHYLDKKRFERYQRSGDGKHFPAQPEVYDFTS